jgi:DNA polymerase delta subunit 1
MVKFGVESVEEAMKLGAEAASIVTKEFLTPIKLEFEKVYFPYLLMNKKRYAGLYWTNPKKHDKMDTKGIETVRRDTCSLVANVVTECLNLILIDRNVNRAIDYAKGIISDLLTNRLDLSLLVISKSLGKGADGSGYVAKQAHVELAERMRKRDPRSAPSVGDRVAYVITKAAKGVPAYEKAEDPIYVLEHDIPIDTEYYLKNQLMLPLTRIFEPILGSTSDLFAGDHTRHIKVSTPSTGGGIMQFAVKKRTCLGCKVPLSADEASVCKHCMHKQDELYVKAMEKVREFEETYSRAWTQCQRCSATLHQDVLCTNRDCSIFYRRKKIQKDLKEAQESLDRFSF